MEIKDKRNFIERLFNINRKKIEATPIVKTERVTTPIYGEEVEKARSILNSIVPTKTAILSTASVVDLNEKDLFNLYRKMDTDSVIAGALDLFADSATKPNYKTGRVVFVESANKDFQNEINNFLQKSTKIDTEARNIVREVLKYGKVFLDVDAVEGEWGFIPVDKPELIQALTLGNDTIKYYASRIEPNDEYSKYKLYSQESGSFEIVQPNKYISLFNQRAHAGSMILETTSAITGEAETVEYRIKTGKSILEPIISTWQTLSTLEDSLFVNRLVKSVSFNIVQIDVSDTTNLERTEMVNNVMAAFKSSETIDQVAKSYNNRQSPIPVNDFIYVPVQGTKGAITVQKIGGELDKLDLSDIEYYNNKKFAGLGVLKAFLGWEETTPSGLGESPLTRLDERFANRVIQVQKILQDCVEQIVEYYWTNSKVGRSLQNMPDYKVILGKVSTQEDDRNRETLRENLNIAQDIVSMAKNDFSEFIDDKKLFEYIFGEVLHIDIRKIDSTPNIEDIKVNIKKIVEQFDKDKIKPLLKEDKVEPKHLDLKIERLKSLNNKHIHKHYDTVESLLNDYLVYRYEESGTRTLINTLIDKPSIKKRLDEATYKSLKKQSRTLDPERIKKAKKIIVKYTGIDDDNYITFETTAEDPEKNRKEGKPTSYKNRIHLKELLEILKETGNFTDANLVRRAVEGDIEISCTCPASKWWGTEYNGTKQGYSIVKNDIAPTRNIPTQVICKHLISVLTVLPFHTNTIVRDLRKKGIIKLKAKKQKEEITD